MSERERLVFQCVADKKNGFEESKGRGAGEVTKKKKFGENLRSRQYYLCAPAVLFVFL